jgi:amino acid transporter
MSTSARRKSEQIDEGALALLGKKQVLKRRFGFISLFGFAVCELITWETVLALFSQAFQNGGPAGNVYGYIIAWVSTLSVYTVISELASMAPIAGGQYYWVYMMAAPEWRNVLSYVVGWLTTLAWIATVATETLFAGTMIQGVVTLDYPGYYLEHMAMYQGTLLTWAVIAVCIFINVVIPNWLPRFEVFILVFHLAGFVAILTTLLVLTPKFAPLEAVWLTALNEGGWPTQGLSFCVGFLGNVATFVGADASVHLAEEVSRPSVNIPRAILGAMLINGALGFAMIITVLYCLNDVEAVLNSPTEFPFIEIFKESVGSVAGASVMTAIVLSLTWACAIGITTTASRMCWSFARDRGLPFWKVLSRVNSRTKVPVAGVLTVTGIAALLTLIYVGSSTAFQDVISLTITGFYGSYLLPSALLLYHRIKGNVLPKGSHPRTNTSADDTAVATDKLGVESPESTAAAPARRADLVWGPWHIPGLLGILNNIYACAYMIFVIFWSVWPPSTPVDAMSMNYSVVVTGGVLILSAIWYYIGGKKQYTGPTIDEEVKDIMGFGSVGDLDADGEVKV